MTTLHYVLLIGGGIALLGLVLWLTRRPTPPSSLPASTGGGAQGNNDVGVAIAGAGAGLGALIGSIVQNQINAEQQQEAAAS